MARHRRAFLGGLIAVALLASACGDDADTDTADSPATSTSSSAPATTSAPPPTVVDSPDDLDLPATAAEVADALVRLEGGIRSDTPAPDELRVWGWEQQNAYRVLAANPDWREDVLAALSPELAPVVTANLEAVTAIATLNQPQPAVPDWRIEPPLPAKVLLGYYREAEGASSIPWPYLAAIHLVETRMGRILGTSSAGAQGPMQFIPSTWAAYGEGDVNDNRDAILAAGRYLDDTGGPEDMAGALFAYNPSDHYVRTIHNYAGLIAADERVYLAYHHWQVYFATEDNVLLLPEGYPEAPAIPVAGTASR